MMYLTKNMCELFVVCVRIESDYRYRLHDIVSGE